MMTLRALPSWACPGVSRICSLTGVCPGLAGLSVAPPVCTDALGPYELPSSRAHPCWRMRDNELLSYFTAACSMSARVSQCRFRASGVEGRAWPAAVSWQQRAFDSLAGLLA
jgi:hypothetical protein